MKNIDIKMVLTFHKKLIEQTGGSEGVRDIGLIESALNRGLMTFGGNDLYSGVDEKIAAITYGLINNHGFIDGNKRIGVAMMLLLLKMNGIQIQYSQQELVELGLGVASGRISENDIREWIERHRV
ncbi:MAG: type toxin-antitoxin system death-on-curing family toxin [Peptococcaceae bacterium]|jgi:death-on-curing protein|nr:type toxin-antitoxin system death-on-curing family toxin [Peptococcaceae bacterium]